MLGVWWQPWDSGQENDIRYTRPSLQDAWESRPDRTQSKTDWDRSVIVSRDQVLFLHPTQSVSSWPVWEEACCAGWSRGHRANVTGFVYVGQTDTTELSLPSQRSKVIAPRDDEPAFSSGMREWHKSRWMGQVSGWAKWRTEAAWVECRRPGWRL